MRAIPVALAIAGAGTQALAQDFVPPRYVLHWGGAGGTPGLFHQPEDLTVAPDGTVYVVDRGNQRVQRFSAGGEFLLAWGENGDQDGMFANPTGIAVDGSGDVYVADRSRLDIQVFTLDGMLKGQLRIPTYRVAVEGDEIYGAAGDSVAVHSSAGRILRTWQVTESTRASLEDVALFPDGRLAVTDVYLAAIFVMERDGSQRVTWGGDGTLGLPRSVASDGKLVYVADFARAAVVVLTLQGTRLADFPVSVPGLGNLRPLSIACGGPGELYVVADAYVVKLSTSTLVRAATWSKIKSLYR